MEGPIYRLEGVVKTREDMQDFVGPLDLILHLLSKNKMEIKDIQISLILQQYLEWMERRKSMDLEVASEFVAMAAHLVYIKTRMLLSLNNQEAASEMEQLIATLEAHRSNENYLKIKAVSGILEQQYLTGREYLVKQPEPLQASKAYEYHHQPEDLRRAMKLVLERMGEKLPPPVTAFAGIVGREPYPVTKKASEILHRLIHFGVSRFRALFQGSRTRSELVATFIAILELCKAKRLQLTDNGEDCVVTVSEGTLPDGELFVDSY